MDYFRLSIYSLCLCLIATSGAAQTVIINDDFNDGDFTAAPLWSGDTGNFIVADDAGNFRLRLNAPAAGSSWLSVASAASYGSWEFFIRFDFSTLSGSNKLTVFLTSDIPDLAGEVNGYALVAGESGSDDVFELVRFDGGSKAATILSGATNVNNGGGYQIKVNRSSDGRWTLAVGSGYGATPVQEAAGNDNTHTSSGYFGFLPEYTSTRTEAFFFDDVIITKAPVEVTSVDVISNREFRVFFTDNVDPASVSGSDFTIDRSAGNPDGIFVLDNSVTLSYDSPLPGGKYRITVSDIDDLSGTTIPAHSSVTFSLFDPFTDGDIVINEFMYDDPPELAEYVEIRNTTSKRFNLAGWMLGDAHAPAVISGDTLILEPGGFLVISPDTAALFNTFGSRNYVKMGSFPTLNNTGDALRIVTDGGVPADSLFYMQDWGGEDVALERRSASTAATFPENWGDSPGGIGTPGLPNDIAPDRTAPDFTGLDIPGPSVLQLTFSEVLDSGSAGNASNYSIAPKTGIQIIAVSGDTVTLFLSQNLVSGTTYGVTVRDIRDIFGNALTSATRSIRYLELSSARAGEVVINEILSKRDPSTDLEFVELFSKSSRNFSLEGWKLGDGAGLVELKGNIILEAGSYLVLTDSESFASSIDNGVYLSGFPSLNDAGDAIYILSETGRTVDSLFYDASWGGMNGVSMERRDPDAASNDPSNWITSTAQEGYSAGVENSGFRPDEFAPEVIFSSSLPGGLFEVRFNEFIGLTQEVRFLAGASELAVDRFDPHRGNRIFLSQPAGKTADMARAREIFIQNVSDVKGNTTASASIPVAAPLVPGSVVINEIMYNPLSDPDDNRPDQSEYIELRNTGETAVSLEGFTLHDAPDENGEVRSLLPVSSVSKWIPANGVLLIYADTADSFERSRTARFFELDPDEFNESRAVRIDRSSLSLASTGDAVYLADSTGTAIDSVFYDESWQNPNLFDTRGVALERINPSGPGNDDSNWSSSTSEKGGTPGSENSIYQIPAGQQEEVGISFNPNPFSPDEDGFEDNLFISYKLDQADYLLNVQVYDRYGRRVRKLADGQPAGFNGSLIWDGLTDEGNRNRIGIYIVLFEAYNSAGGENRAFKELVVLARRM